MYYIYDIPILYIVIGGTRVFILDWAIFFFNLFVYLYFVYTFVTLSIYDFSFKNKSSYR